MSTDVSYLTPEGAAKLRAELEQLRGPQREDISRRLREAIEMGDLSENADYHTAKEDQGFLEGRIQELEYLLQNFVVIEQKVGVKSIVEVGVTVTIQEKGEEPETYQIVGGKESDPKKGRISNDSPIGSALIGKALGDTVDVQTPGGVIQFEIVKIE
jgi:transcription elongation factor GreA